MGLTPRWQSSSHELCTARSEKRLKLSTLFTATKTEEPTKYLARYNHPQKLPVWAQHAFQVVADPVGETYECECRLWDHTGE